MPTTSALIATSVRSLSISPQPQGQQLLRELLSHCDVLVENFKVGGLAKYQLDYDALRTDFPALIYCSITGFGQTGPYAARAGYDFMIQAMGGIMSLTGEPEETPQKVGVAIADIMAGMYAATAILAALRHRDHGGGGQHIDIALLDSQVAWLMNTASNYLTSGRKPQRYGNAHPNIVPYQAFASSDGFIIVAVGNDSQFTKLCQFAGCPELSQDPRFASNPARVTNREALIPRLQEVLRQHSAEHWLRGLSERGVPCGPINELPQVFADPQVQHRQMRIQMPHPQAGGDIDLVANPLKLSQTPVRYRHPPPSLAEHTDEILQQLLAMEPEDCERLRRQGVL